MLLASVEKIRTQIGFDDMPDVNAAIEAALGAADALLQARIGSDFARATGLVDKFYMKEPGFTNGVSYTTQFRLTRGFVTLTSVQVSQYLTTFDAEADTKANFVLDAPKGLLKDIGTNYIDQFMKVTYDAGFPVDGLNAASYDLSVVPDWLQQAATLRALISLAGHPVLENAAVKLDNKMLNKELEAIIARHIRYTPVALLPL